MAASERKSKNIVLVLFRGENFVNLTRKAQKFTIRAKLCKNTIESKEFDIDSVNKHPLINCQLVWSFSQKEFTEIVSHHESIRIECISFTECDSTIQSNRIGYIIVKVKDAFRLGNIQEVDPSHAVAAPLLGTDRNWSEYQPKLHYMIYTEENTYDEPNQNLKETEQNDDKESEKILEKRDVDDAEKEKLVNNVLVRTINDLEMKSSYCYISPVKDEDFIWTINNENLCFELNTPKEGDDFFIIDLSILAVDNLEQLYERRHSFQPCNDEWEISYTMYGCEIKSERFSISRDSNTTYIGDKSTARIRSNRDIFYKYLSKTAVPFRVILYPDKAPDKDGRTMGLCFFDLLSIANPEVNEFKTSLDFVHEWGTNRVFDPQKKPSLVIAVNKSSHMNYFNEKAEEVKEKPLNPVQQVENTEEYEDTLKKSLNDSHRSVKSVNETVNKIIDTVVRDINTVFDVKKNTTTIESERQNNGEGDRFRSYSNQPVPASTIVNDPLENALYEDGTSQAKKEGDSLSPVAEVAVPLKNERCSSSSSSEYSFSSKSSAKVSERYEMRGSKGKKSRFSFSPDLKGVSPEASESDDIESDFSPKESSHSALVKFEFVLNIRDLWLKLRSPARKIIATYNCVPLFISHESCLNKIKLLLVKNRTRGNAYFYEPVNDNGNTIVKTELRRSDLPKLCDCKLPVEISATFGNGSTKAEKKLYCNIPFGDIVVEKERGGYRSMSTSASIRVHGTQKKVGELNFKLKMIELKNYPRKKQRNKEFMKIREEKIQLTCPTEMQNHERKRFVSNPIGNAYEKHLESSDIVYKTMAEFDVWKKKQEAEFKKKMEEREDNFFQLMSEEWQKKDFERNKTFEKRLNDLKKREQELSDKKRKLTKAQDEVDKLKSQIKIELEEGLAEKRTFMEECKHKITIAKEEQKVALNSIRQEHKVEVSCLMRQNADLEVEIGRLKSKICDLQESIAQKDLALEQIRSERFIFPDSGAIENVRLLEQEVQTLKKRMNEIEKQRDQYREQSIMLCQKMNQLKLIHQKSLIDENENLKVQLLAKEHQKEMKRDKKHIQVVYDKLKEMKSESQGKSHEQQRENVEEYSYGNVSKPEIISIRRPKKSLVSGTPMLDYPYDDVKSQDISTSSYSSFSEEDEIMKKIEKLSPRKDATEL